MKRGSEYFKEWNTFILSGDEEAFHALYSHYFKYLYYIGIKKGFPSDRVKDNINDVFLYLWNKRNNLDDITQHHNYIVTCFLRKLYRKENIQFDDSVAFSELPELHIVPSVENLYTAQSAREDISRIIKIFIAKLPEKQRKMMYQKFYLGLSYKEIADTNNISVNTVYNTIYKALEKLKTEFGKNKSTALKLAFILFYLLLLIFFSRNS